VNKVDGRLNRLLVRASSALQDGIQKRRPERGAQTKVWGDSGATGIRHLVIGQNFCEQEPVDLAVRE